MSADEAIKTLEENRDVDGLIAVLHDRASGTSVHEGEYYWVLPGAHRSSENDRVEAALALGRLGELRAIDALIAVLAAHDVTIQAAEEALSMFPTSELVPVLVGLLHSMRPQEIIEQLRHGGAGADLIRLLPFGAGPIEDHVSELVTHVAKAAKGELWRVLNDRAAECSSRLLDELSVITDQKFDVPAYEQNSRYPLWRGEVVAGMRVTIDCSGIRKLAAAELERRPDWVAERDSTDPDALLQRLRDPDIRDHHRQAAAETLARSGDPSVVEPLAQALQSDNIDIRRAAAVALAGVADARALGAVMAALADQNHGLGSDGAIAVEQAFDRIAALGEMDAFLHVLESVRGTSLERVIAVVSGSNDVRAIDPLVTVLHRAVSERDLDVMKLSIEALQGFGSVAAEGLASAIEPLVQFLQESFETNDRRTADKVTAALKRTGAAKPEALVVGLSHARPEVRWTVAELLNEVGSRECIAALTKALDDPDEGVREAVSVALERIESR